MALDIWYFKTILTEFRISKSTASTSVGMQLTRCSAQNNHSLVHASLTTLHVVPEGQSSLRILLFPAAHRPTSEDTRLVGWEGLRYLTPLLWKFSCPVHYGRHLPCMPTEQLKCSYYSEGLNSSFNFISISLSLYNSQVASDCK